MAVALRLAERGWGGGNPETILEMRADLVMAALDYSSFKDEYERAWLDLNKESR